jgi:hypothetical protein
MTILAWAIGILAVGLIDGGMILLLCKASGRASRDEELEEALQRAQEAEEAGKKELEDAKAKIMAEVKK